MIISYLDANQFILPASGAAIGVEWHQGKRVEPGKRNNPTAGFLQIEPVTTLHIIDFWRGGCILIVARWKTMV